MSCTLNGLKGHMIIIYDFMKTNEQKAWLVIKKQMSRFKIGLKVSNDECKDILTCWKGHELQF